jgi:DNA-binding LacI/PurR family transcriptional regulator/C4-dicarboxylate-specific signal transduction histidine kinase
VAVHKIAPEVQAATLPVGSEPHRYTLGLFVDWLEDEYQNAVLCGAADAAKAHGASLLCFPGGGLETSERLGTQRNLIYQLAGTENIAGLLVLSGSLGNAVGPGGLGRFCERFRPLPLCSVAVPLPGIPSLLVDNASGIREALRHLVEHHGYRRIAFIRGPEANTEAERRYHAYRQVLKEKSLPHDPAWVVVGDFQRSSGREAVAELLDRRRLELDAILAASDTMALGAIEALRDRGLRVPEDMAVVGFDDVEEARFHNPPLTTVRQPLYEQGYRAAEIVLGQLVGQAVPDRVLLSTELVVRRSCGCPSQAFEPTSIGPSSGNTGTWEECLLRHRDEILASLRLPLKVGEDPLPAHWEAEFLQAFFTDLRDPTQAAFSGWLDQTLERWRETGKDLNPWHGVVSALRQHALRCLAGNPDYQMRAENRLHEARRILGVAVERAQAQQRLRIERRARMLSRAAESLITAFDVESLVRSVELLMPRLEIPSCYLSLYEGVCMPAEHSRLVLAHDSTGRLGPPAGTVFPSKQLVPEGVLGRGRPSAFIVEPLFFREEQLGFVLFEMGPREGSIYETLRDQISAAMKGALLVERVVEQDQERQRLLRALEKRAQEVTEAYDALKANQEKLLLQEKMASLGRLAASIAHEMNTPLAAARTALIELEKLVAEYRLSVGDSDVSPLDHDQIAAEMRKSIRLASSSAKRAADYVRGIKTQTRDPGPRERERFDAVPYIREALLLLSYSLRQGNCTAQFEPPSESFELQGSPGRLAQVVTNLVTNAIDAAAGKGVSRITLDLCKENGQIRLTVADQGTGIDPDIMPKIFDPMFTTKPFGQGTGLGLAIVKDIVTRDFGGSIEVTTEAGKGTVFILRFPAAREP